MLSANAVVLSAKSATKESSAILAMKEFVMIILETMNLKLVII